MNKNDKSLEFEWKKLNPEGFIYNNEIPKKTNAVGEPKNKAIKFYEKGGFVDMESLNSMIDDQVMVLYTLVNNKRKVLEHPSQVIKKKAVLMLDHLEELKYEDLSESDDASDCSERELLFRLE